MMLMETKTKYEYINPDMKRTTVYLPIVLYQSILAAAKKNMVSYTAQVRLILAEWLDQTKGEQK